MKKISFEKMDSFLRAIAQKMSLYLPVDGKSGAEFEKWEEGKKLSTALNTNRSAKDFFFPQTENLAAFKIEGKKIEVIDERKETEDFVLFGVRACDCKSFEVLDRVFLSEPVDSFYKNRREKGIVITLACTEPEETCFCTNFGIDATDPAGDISAWHVGNEMFFRPNTDKGEKLLNSLSDLLEEGGEAKVEAQKKAVKAVMERLPLKKLPTEHFQSAEMMELFNSPDWKELSRSCLGCGTCTFVCPTCQCFDIRDFDTGEGIQRFRCWDSCMYSEFTKMAHANPRLTQTERFRQRFMHKLVYYPANNGGLFGCVGCGRCLSKCPVSMNIVKVIKKIGGEN